MAIDLLIPYRSVPSTNDFELRYSLRSIEKYCKGMDKVIIIGNKPSFVTNVCHIGNNRMFSQFHENNICEKTIFACSHTGLSDNFLFWNDDFFLTKEIDAETYPYYQCGDLNDLLETRIHQGDGYRQSILNTITALQRRGKRTLNYDLHCPIIYNKAKFIEIMQDVDWSVSNGYVIKSLYANMVGVENQFMSDNKINSDITDKEFEKIISTRHIFSIGERGLTDELKGRIEKLYPTKSKFEL